MRTTITISDDLLKRARRKAADSGKSLTEVFNDALREGLAVRPVASAESVELPIFGRKGLQPGVDLDDTAALLDVMDSGDSLRR